ncbi:DegT/DnrJ/EryC1/StrS family aminotransferase [Shimia thalassica]|uniref:UDP-4-amino-4-deoxy-L-arabinose--oxoglutarate aminotransferase n=1 Tax=Shimia thalassica TaxID=1715693 RepID=A0A0P1IE45_9RHOB|nr:DegT/DnrJ/EryC1/StrS family aminotransferase [Shimia thalassica]PHO05667.1 DegT/DnrJ/EryC1/StrS family aminotransferase [Rhodobacteraceae bacterium 4F10]MBU2944851.1 DegT/DnrJ/EryC1/StrS family aminotransferase [Shimia thalassica]MDO6504844.1 DegT/DnrJ/EryC1/StrS family aminotransferase [Shimia thalassica]MDO6523581.1 DegT/DnrJ/EryC1/StrS family aminotransferase [Shimia thalassica]MDP2494281.1 DegT/DnrJ/EryC1/StrS family aminotransferase [Shimia thalassica]
MSIRFPLATSSWDQKELDALQKVIDSDRYSMGAEVANFEQQFAEHFGSKFAIMVNSGSSANLLMTAALFFTKNPALHLERGDEIIVPAVSWSTTYFPLNQYGLHLKFVDIDLETLNYDLAALEEAVTDKTRAIMVVNLLGNPNDFDALNRIIDGRDIVVIEDNCESMGATFNGKQTGTFGAMGSYSCFFSHHISTMEGGMVVTDDEELYHVMLALRAHGWTRNLPKFNHVTGEKSDDPFEESFRFVLPGYNLRPLEMSGALGIEQLAKLPDLIKGRRANGALVQQRLANHPKFMIQREIGEASWFGFSLVIRPDTGLNRADLVKDLVEAGFECRPIVAGNFAKNEVMKYFDYSIHGDLKNADYIDANGLFVGNHHYPIAEAVDALTRI